MNDSSSSAIRLRRSSAVRFLVLAALVLLFYWFAARRAESRLTWLRDFDVAVAEAQARKVPILLDFWASWCGPCLSFDATVFSSESVEQVASRRYVLMRIDLTNRSPGTPDAEIAEHYGVSALPTLLVVDAASRDLIARASQTDRASPEAFVAFLRRHSRANSH